MKQTPGPVIGAPSFVLPANVADNARFLAGRVDEVALCLFEARSCLAYDDEDLPPALTDLPLSWHVHLPVDLPWPRKKDADAVRVAVELALRVFDRVAWLKPWGAVLHAPKGSPVLQRFILRQAAACWQRRSKVPLLLENTDICDIAGLGRGFPADHGLGFCLDVGHLMGYAQNALWASPLPSGPGPLERPRHPGPASGPAPAHGDPAASGTATGRPPAQELPSSAGDLPLAGGGGIPAPPARPAGQPAGYRVPRLPARPPQRQNSGVKRS